MPGVKVKLRTKEYEIPSLCFDEVERFSADGTLARVPLNAATMIAHPDSREAAMTVLLAALRWNYPEITREEVSRELDLENCARAMDAVMGSSGLLAAAKESGAGEAKP